MRIVVDFVGDDLASAMQSLGLEHEAWDERDPRLSPQVVARASSETTIQVLAGRARLLLPDALPALRPGHETVRIGGFERFARATWKTRKDDVDGPLQGRTAYLVPGDVVVVDAGQRFGLAAADERTILRVDPPISRCCQ